MAQGYDKYELDNQTGQSFRFALNDILEAAATQNSGDNSPNTTNTSYPYQVWVDTTNDIVKIRDAATAGSWYSLYSVDSDGKPTGAVAYGSYTIATNDTAGTGGTTAITVDTSQRVGIGTATFDSTSESLRLENSGGTTHLSVIATDTSTGLSIVNLGDSDDYNIGRIDYDHSTNSLNFRTNNNTRASITSGGTFLHYGAGSASTPAVNLNGAAPVASMTVDSSGRLLVGTSSSSSVGSSATAKLQTIHSGSNLSASFTSTIDATGPSGIIVLGHGRGSVSGLLNSSDSVGEIRFAGGDGTDAVTLAASIQCYVDGTPGANDMPGRLIFSTTADGASSPTERWRYTNNGETQVRNMAELFPVSDNVCLLGKSGARWKQVWAANGTIQTSDERAKTEIVDATLGIDFVKSLHPVSYKWIEGGKRHTGEFDEDGNYIYESVSGARRHWGFIAQEVKESVDAAGVDFGGWVLTDKDDPDSQQALRYDQFIAPLTKALQEALEKIETLEAKVAALESA